MQESDEAHLRSGKWISSHLPLSFKRKLLIPPCIGQLYEEFGELFDDDLDTVLAFLGGRL